MSRLKQPQEHDDLLNYQLKRLLNLGGAPAIRLCEGRYGVARMEWRLVAALQEDGPMPLLALEGFLQRLTSQAREILQQGGGVDARTDRRLGGSRRLWPHPHP